MIPTPRHQKSLRIKALQASAIISTVRYQAGFSPEWRRETFEQQLRAFQLQLSWLPSSCFHVFHSSAWATCWGHKESACGSRMGSLPSVRASGYVAVPAVVWSQSHTRCYTRTQVLSRSQINDPAVGRLLSPARALPCTRLLIPAPFLCGAAAAWLRHRSEVRAWAVWDFWIC